MSQTYNAEFAPSKKLRLATLMARVVTAVTLVVSIIVLKLNTVTFDTGFTLTYTYWSAYKYMFYVMVFGFIYTILQIPFAMYYLLKAKRLLHHYGFLQFDLYGDKITSLLLATGVGAAFGATVILKKYTKDFDSKINGFFDMAYISVAFLLIGFLSSGISSVLSSFALFKNS